MTELPAEETPKIILRVLFDAEYEKFPGHFFDRISFHINEKKKGATYEDVLRSLIDAEASDARYDVDLKLMGNDEFLLFGSRSDGNASSFLVSYFTDPGDFSVRHMENYRTCLDKFMTPEALADCERIANQLLKPVGPATRRLKIESPTGRLR